MAWDPEFESFRHQLNLEAENESFLQHLDRAWEAIVRNWEDNEAPDNEAQNGDASAEDDEDEDLFDANDVVRTFMRNAESGFDYLDQARVVEQFCNGASLEALQTGSYECCEDVVALLDERENKPHPSGVFELVHQGSARPYKGPLSHRKLLDELNSPRFKVRSVPGDLSDADRRVLYITNLDRWTTLVLVTTASRSQAPALRRMIYHHLTSRTSIAVDISPRYKTFSLEFSIPYCVLVVAKPHRQPSANKRRKCDGCGASRKSWKVPTFQWIASTETGVLQHASTLCESHLSVSVLGVDKYRWVAYGFFDHPPDQKKGVTYYHGITDGTGARPDPLTAGQIDPECDPRKYFLEVLGIQIQEIRKHYDFILRMLESNFARSTPELSKLDFKNEEVRRKVKDMDNWTSEMVQITVHLLNRVSSALSVWESFQNGDISYFHHLIDGERSADRQSSPLFRKIEKEFRGLEVIHKELEKLRQGLKDRVRERDSRFLFENDDHAILQHQTGEHVKLLTWVTILWLPVSVTAGLCSIQDGSIMGAVRQNLSGFVGSFSVIFALVGLTVAALLYSNLLRIHMANLLNSSLPGLKPQQAGLLPLYNTGSLPPSQAPCEEAMRRIRRSREFNDIEQRM